MQPFNEGEIFHDRYRIVRVLGIGGMGVVYEAMQLDAQRTVALKILDENNIEVTEFRERFLREFRALSALSNEHIVTFYSAAITEDGLPYAVCELLPGKTLKEHIVTDGKLDWHRVQRILQQITQAMTAAHQLGIVHRDLKPENIILQETPEKDWVKVLDFGLSKFTAPQIGEQQKLTKTGAVVGTINYMSPEQCLGKQVDARSDIYSMACIAYECLSGKQLFESDTPYSIMHDHIHKKADSGLHKLHGSCPDSFIALLQEMLEKDPNKRPQTMTEVSARLEGIDESKKKGAFQPSDAGILKTKAIAAALIGFAALAGFSSIVILLNRNDKHSSTLSKKITKNQPNKINRMSSAPEILRRAKLLGTSADPYVLLDLYKKALKAADRTDDTGSTFDALAAMAVIYDELKQSDLAEETWRKAAIVIPNPSTDKHIRAICGLAQHFSGLGQFKRAEEEYLNIISDCEKDGYYNNAMLNACTFYIQMLIKQRDDVKAYAFGKRAIKDSDNCNTQGRVTVEGVGITWMFYDLCSRINKKEEGKLAVESEKAQLKKHLLTRPMKDEYSVTAVVIFAEQAQKLHLNTMAKEMFDLALADCHNLVPQDQKRVKARVMPSLAQLEKDQKAE